jgi:hypothetical protein
LFVLQRRDHEIDADAALYPLFADYLSLLRWPPCSALLVFRSSLSGAYSVGAA